jgi:hypothetical protein
MTSPLEVDLIESARAPSTRASGAATDVLGRAPPTIAPRRASAELGTGVTTELRPTEQ